MSVIVVFVNEEVFILTGASSGIGRGTAIHLSTLGCRLVLAGRDAAALQVLISDFYVYCVISISRLGKPRTSVLSYLLYRVVQKNATTFNKS